MQENIKYLIVGGGVAGTTAAEIIRSVDKDGSIAIVSDELYRLYSRIMLSKPNFFLEKIPFDNVWLKTDDWYKKNNIEFINGKKAVSIDVTNKTITLNDDKTIKYEKLLLAIGSSTRAWEAPGANKKGVFYLRTLDDAKKIIAEVKTAKEAVCVGGGFVSFEMCDMLKMAGIDVTLVLRESHYWEPLLDEPSGRIIEEALKKGGVKIILNSETKEILGGEKVESIVLNNGRTIPCQIIIAGIGVCCQLEQIKSSGIQTNRGILANEYLETNITDIYTAGDCAEFKDVILGESVQLGNWVNAQMQGKIAGGNMTGKKDPFKMVSFYTTQGFGITIAFVGDVRPSADRSIITRGSFEIGSYGRIIIKDGEIIGATLINRTQELWTISKLIEKDFKIAGHETELSNPDCKLQELIK
ncbi:MAG: FAD-dependent oxidoreductase [Patescibacteria group bacterium]